MQEIKITFNEKEGLQASEYAWDKDGKKFLIENIKGEEVKEFLNIIHNEQIKGTKIVSENIQMVIYNNYYIVLKDYQKLQQLGLLEQYFLTIDKYEKNKIKSISPVVKRQNKHTGGKIIPIGLSIILLLTTGYVTIKGKLEQNALDENTKLIAYESVENIEYNQPLDDFKTPHVSDDIELPIANIVPSETTNFYEESTYIPEVTTEIETTKEPSIDENNYIFIEYEDRSNYDKAAKTKELYGDLIEKYATTYGLDPNLVLALATQERGVHSSVVDSGGGIGLMQLQKHVWIDYSLTAYNHETGKKDTIYITLEKLQDCETNIQLGCMILQTFMKQNNYNIILGLQAYNMGTRGVGKAVTAYAEDTCQSKEDIINNPSDCGWLDYREGIAGDPLYVEHVLSYIGSDIEIYVYKNDGTKVTCNVRNYEHTLSR